MSNCKEMCTFIIIYLLSNSRMKFQWRSFGYKSKVVVLCSVANFINAADRVLMPLAIVPMTNEYKWSLYWQGWILSAFAFGYFTSQVRVYVRIFVVLMPLLVFTLFMHKLGQWNKIMSPVGFVIKWRAVSRNIIRFCEEVPYRGNYSELKKELGLLC